jgi:two-component system sensor histidine kinase YesM
MKDVINTLINEAEVLTANISLNDNVHIYLITNEDKQLISDLQQKISAYVQSFVYTRSEVESIYIYSEKSDTIIDNNKITHRSEFSDVQWYETYQKIEGRNTVLKYRNKNNYYPYLISIIKPIYYDKNTCAGAVITNIDVERMGKIVKNNRNPSLQYMMILDENGIIAYSQHTMMIGTHISGADRFGLY